jgi:hypothetical protein
MYVFKFCIKIIYQYLFMRLFSSYLLIFIGILAFYTEGVSQKVQDAVVVQDSLSEVVVLDSLEDDMVSTNHNRYKENEEKYKQEDLKQKDFDQDSWQKAKAGLDYTIKKDPKEEEEKIKNNNTTISSPKLSGALVEFLKWFFIIGAIVLIAFLILKFVSEGNVLGKSSKKIYAPSVHIDLEKIEENLQDAELDPFIKQAITQKQFNLAIRLYYLAIVKELSLMNAIEWKKDKTNRAYIREMRKNELFEPFRHITSIFERVWYGDSVLQESDFNMIHPVFQDLLNQTRKTVLHKKS